MRFKALLFILLLGSCTAQKRCERKLLKAQKLGCLSYSNDTIIIRDTIKGFKIDTFVQFDTLNLQDTLIVEKDGVVSQTIIKWKERIVTQNILKRDTIIENQIITKTKVVKLVPKWFRFLKFFGIVLLVCFFILFVVYLLSKLKKIFFPLV